MCKKTSQLSLFKNSLFITYQPYIQWYLLNFVGYCDLASFKKVHPENKNYDQKILDNQKVLELFVVYPYGK